MGLLAVYCLTAALDTGAVARSPSPQDWDLPGEANGTAVSAWELLEHGPTHRASWGSSPNPEDVSCLRLPTQYTPSQAGLQRSHRGRALKQQDVTLDTGISTLHRLGAPPLSCDVPTHIPLTGCAPAVAAQQPQLGCNDRSGDLLAPPRLGSVPEAGGPGQPPGINPDTLTTAPPAGLSVPPSGTVFTFPAALDGPSPHRPAISPSSPPPSAPAPHPSSSLRDDPGPFLGPPTCPALVGVLKPPVQ
ncbi:hypothetical protein EI555_015856, partial [Monodon monoceros]